MFATFNVISPVQYVSYFYISTFRSTCAVPNMAVFCSSLISCFPGMLLGYCLNDFGMVPVALLLLVFILVFIMVMIIIIIIIIISHLFMSLKFGILE